MSLLRDLAHVHLPVGRREMTVEVRREAGAPMYRCTMTIVGEMVKGSQVAGPHLNLGEQPALPHRMIIRR